MEFFNFSLDGDSLRIEGFPDAAAVVALTGFKARRLAHLALHMRDLKFAASCLEAINSVPDDPHTIRSALWTSAITHYVKCFGDGERFQLSANKIYRNDSKNALDAFNFFKTLRNKHVVHDENSFAQADPLAIISNDTKPYKVEKIICSVMFTVTLEQEAYANLSLLVNQALEWVIAEHDSYCSQISSELEVLERDDLLALPRPKFIPAKVSEVHLTRKQI